MVISILEEFEGKDREGKVVTVQVMKAYGGLGL
jgi:hypothetical protein